MGIHYLYHENSDSSENELRKLTIVLYIKLCLAVWRDPYGAKVWRMKKSEDDDHFYLGIGTKPGEQMRMEIPIEFWENAVFAKELNRLPLYDGHDLPEIIERMDQFLRI